MPGRTYGIGLYAPAGFATDAATIARAVSRLEAAGHRVVVDPDRGDPVAAIFRARRRTAGCRDAHGKRPARRPGDRRSWRLRLVAPARTAGLRRHRGGEQALARSQRFHGVPAGSPRGDEHGHVFRTDGRVRFRRGDSVRIHAGSLLGADRVDATRDHLSARRGAQFHRRGHVVGRQSRNARASGRDAVPAADRWRHSLCRGRRRATLSHRAHALSTAPRRHSRTTTRTSARRIQRFRTRRPTTTATTLRR